MSDIIKAAGGVVVRGKKILFIKKNGRWEFPKGRLKKRANFNIKIYRKLRQLQLPLEIKKKRANFIINNNFNNKSLRKNVKKLLGKILSNA